MRVSGFDDGIAIFFFDPYGGGMNPKGILIVAVMVLFGGTRIMSEIEVGKAVELTISRATVMDIANIEAGRSIQITIGGVPAEEKAKIDATYPVSKEGMVNLPFIGKMKAAGKTAEELKAAIEKAYVDGGIYEAPEIQILSSPGCGGPLVAQVHIGGQVLKTGPIDFADGMTLGDAIKAAGGATEFGSLKRVKLYRDGLMTSYDLTKKGSMAIPLEKNDTLEVSAKNFGCR